MATAGWVLMFNVHQPSKLSWQEEDPGLPRFVLWLNLSVCLSICLYSIHLTGGARDEMEMHGKQPERCYM